MKFSYVSSRRRRGIAMVYVGMLLGLVLIPALAFSIDMGRLYVCKAQAQKAADAAALAGAYQYANLTGAQADTQARIYAKDPKNGGYEQGVRDTTVTTLYQPNDEFNVKQYNWYRVSIKRLEPTFFAPIFGPQFRTIAVTAQSTALYENTVPMDITGSSAGLNGTAGAYGIAPGPTNLSLFGPDGFYNNGDKYSVRKLADRTTPNPNYNGPDSTKSRKGYDFLVTIPKTFKDANSIAYFQIFDPDCYNAANNTEANGLTTVDEMRKSDGSAGLTDVVNGASKTTATTTQYTLYLDNGTPEYSDDTVLAQRSYGADATTDMKWNDFYSGNPQGLPAGQGLRLNVMSTDGSSENGFSLRVSSLPANSIIPFNSNNGTTIKADGYLPINFNIGGTVTMPLGTVSASSVNTQLSISKFDTDVTNGNRPNTVNYFCDPPPSNQPSTGFPGVLSGNGDEKTDIISLPANYAGGKWTAVYSAGAQDTSVWSMSYTGSTTGTGKPGRIKIIR